MALETLAGIKKIGEFDVLQERPVDANGKVMWDLFDEMRKTQPIYIDHDVNMISFRIQNGPIKEHGVNGCQVDTIIEAAKLIIEGLNKYYPCDENIGIISNLNQALAWSEARRCRRERQGIEGLNKEVKE